MLKSLIAAGAIAIAVTSTAGAASAADAAPEAIAVSPPEDNDVFAGMSAFRLVSAPTGTGRHGNPAVIAAKMDDRGGVVPLDAR